MEKQKLPNEKTVMILGIVSFIGCCCTSGILGALLSSIGLYLAIQSEKIHFSNPGQYDINSLNTWKIVNIVSLCISMFFVLRLIYLVATGQLGEIIEQSKELIEQFQNR